MEKGRPEEKLKEKVRHGDTFFPFQHYLADFCPPSAGLPLHWHPEMEFTKILEGTAVYSIDFQEYPVQAGDYVCVQPGLLHGARMAPSAFLHSDTFVFHLNFLGSSSADICTLKYFSPVMEGNLRFPQVIFRNDPLYPELDGLFQALSSCYQGKEDGYELEIKALLFTLVRLLLNHPRTFHVKEKDPHSERLKLIFDYIHGHYAEEISVEDMARLCSITPSHFMHYFKEKSGTNFSRYLTWYRLSQSALLLRQGAEIAEAAYACGFNNLPYFYRRFREVYQMTPREFCKSVSSAPETVPL